MKSLAAFDGFAEWRQKEFNELPQLVQRRLRYLQNPVDCNTAKKLLCRMQSVSEGNSTI